MKSRLRDEKKAHLIVFGLSMQAKLFGVLKVACVKAGFSRPQSARRFGKERKDAQGKVKLRLLRLTFSDLVPR
ncbi:hypothetical protein Ciccas_000276 [Cichlidogyrus casuarinus]|uniref:Uncharacterized protein n=1 Tax=Cichlidogyrus casuarinus TaxID=1844966 RepID=A0ABD2QPG9_9PLAT